MPKYSAQRLCIDAQILVCLVDADDQRHRKDRKTVRFEHSADLAHRPVIFTDMFKDMGAQQDIYRSVGTGIHLREVDALVHGLPADVGTAVGNEWVPPRFLGNA